MAVTTFKAGDYVAICDWCGCKDHASNMQMEWDGLFVHKYRCWEARQPQDFVRGVPDFQNVPIPRPQAPDVFVAPGDVTPGDL